MAYPGSRYDPAAGAPPRRPVADNGPRVLLVRGRRRQRLCPRTVVGRRRLASRRFGWRRNGPPHVDQRRYWRPRRGRRWSRSRKNNGRPSCGRRAVGRTGPTHGPHRRRAWKRWQSGCAPPTHSFATRRRRVPLGAGLGGVVDLRSRRPGGAAGRGRTVNGSQFPPRWRRRRDWVCAGARPFLPPRRMRAGKEHHGATQRAGRRRRRVRLVVIVGRASARSVAESSRRARPVLGTIAFVIVFMIVPGGRVFAGGSPPGSPVPLRPPCPPAPGRGTVLRAWFRRPFVGVVRDRAIAPGAPASSLDAAICDTPGRPAPSNSGPGTRDDAWPGPRRGRPQRHRTLASSGLRGEPAVYSVAERGAHPRTLFDSHL